MGKRTVEETSLVAVADTIREKTGTTDKLVFPEGLKSAVEGLVDPGTYLGEVMNLEVTELVNNSVTRVPPFLQEGSTKLEKVDMTAVTTVGEKSFYACTKLAYVNLPAMKSVDPQSFGNCSALTELYLPSLETINGWGYTFSYCPNLQKVHLPKLTNITAAAFAGCSKLSALILGVGSVCALASTDALAETPIASGAGCIYVPKALVDSYKAATNWSTYASKFRAIEDYPDITGG